MTCGIQVLSTENTELPTRNLPTTSAETGPSPVCREAGPCRENVSTSLPTGSTQPTAHAGITSRISGHSGQIVYARGPIAGLAEEHASRHERFQELDQLQAGWEVELKTRGVGSTIDASFFDPNGRYFKSYAEARRAALHHSKSQHDNTTSSV